MTADDANLEDVPSPDEDLVAYLDGELDPATSQQVESNLAQDAAARTKAESLRKTYDLMDYLPKPEPSATFATRTLTKIDAVSAPAGPSQNGMPTTAHASTGAAFNFNNASSVSVPVAVPPSRSWPLWLWCCAASVAAIIGYFGHLLAKPHLQSFGNVQTAQHVRLMERLPFYTGVDDLAFLKKLDEQDLFPEFDYDNESPKPAAVLTTESVNSTDLARLDESFRKLPVVRQTQLRQLDEDLHALDAATKARLEGVLERYAVWLDQLPEDFRREILVVPAADERVEAVRRVKNRLWRKNLPAAVRTKLDNAADLDEQDRILNEVKRQDQLRRKEWDDARRQWAKRNSTEKPFPFDNPELTKQVEDYVATVLKPRMSAWETSQLDELRKHTSQGGFLVWHMYGGAILAASERYPYLPEPRNGKPVRKVEDLQQELVRRLRPGTPVRPGSEKRELRNLPQYDKWPDFAEEITREADQRGIPHPPLGPCRPGEFKQDVDEAVTLLLDKLPPREKQDLESKQGKWPEYPKMLISLARRHDFVLPGVMLPGSPKAWLTAYPPREKK